MPKPESPPRAAPRAFTGLPTRAFAISKKKSSASKRCLPALPVCWLLPKYRSTTMEWFAQFFSRRRRYDDISISIQEHIEERTEELMADGMPRKQAEQTARREFGNVTLLEERSREVCIPPTEKIAGLCCHRSAHAGHRNRRQHGRVQRGQWRSFEAPALPRFRTTCLVMAQRAWRRRTCKFFQWPSAFRVDVLHFPGTQPNLPVDGHLDAEQRQRNGRSGTGAGANRNDQ